jgi:hypothetical protein
MFYWMKRVFGGGGFGAEALALEANSDLESAVDLGSALEPEPKSLDAKRLFSNSLLASQCFVLGTSPFELPLPPERSARLTAEVFQLQRAGGLEPLAWCLEHIVAEVGARLRRDDEAT